jgi:hypothetical protein
MTQHIALDSQEYVEDSYTFKNSSKAWQILSFPYKSIKKWQNNHQIYNAVKKKTSVNFDIKNSYKKYDTRLINAVWPCFFS